MNAKYGFSPEHDFEFERSRQPIQFVERVDVKEGVVCDVYTFPNDPSKDLGIIRIQPGCVTPLQLVLNGERTIEGHVSGKGRLIIVRGGVKEEAHWVSDKMANKFQVDINVGDLMQWQADRDSELVAYEICIPPYKDGRFENLQ